jgi:predicted HicB family RNase H-like nuclease
MSKQPADIGIRLRPEDKSLKEELEKMAAELGLSLNAYLILVLKKHVKTKGKLGI